MILKYYLGLILFDNIIFYKIQVIGFNIQVGLFVNYVVWIKNDRFLQGEKKNQGFLCLGFIRNVCIELVIEF